MSLRNSSSISGFILLGFSVSPGERVALFTAFLLVYIITVLGNLIIVALVAITPKLHIPMYLFLSNLACVDIGVSSVTVPRMLVDLLAERKYIALNECITQIFGFVFLGGTEVPLLSVMCYDRYVAISHPLQYTVIMNRRFCIMLLAISWVTGFLYSCTLTIHVSQFPFCRANVIDHFLCEIPNLLKLACAVTLPNEIEIFLLSGGMALITCLVVFMSYVHILRVILKISSAEGRRKAFTTCSSNLIVLFLFFGTGAGTHLKPSARSLGQDKLASLFYTVFTPMWNPMIYSLRNGEMKSAARKALKCNEKVLMKLLVVSV
ncbi:olfactory receptor 2B6-like [Ambystoma mexicanum]|uniref:olfactory receptor 2B6-like n=1 Tax=Ambystoma mexicanum TaxID=8296 RepID=UPI0037E8C1BD